MDSVPSKSEVKEMNKLLAFAIIMSIIIITGVLIYAFNTTTTGVAAADDQLLMANIQYSVSKLSLAG